VRDGSRQAGRGRVDGVLDVLLEVDLLDVDLLEGDLLDGGGQSTRTGCDGALPTVPSPEPDISERVTVIEFLWTGSGGAQPVILITREWLQ
jgi:hypothetical protein